MGGHTPFYVLDDRGRETLMNCKTERACQMAWKRDQAAAARFGIPEAKIIAMWLVTDPRPPEAQAFLENKREMDDYRKIGKSIGINWNNVSFTVAQFKKGLHTEMKEHHDDQETKVVTTAEEAGKIAWVHLKEDDKYYDKLAKMEESAILFKIGMKCLREAVGNESDISKPKGKHKSVPPIPQDVKTIDIDDEKKSWLKKWWNKYKSAIKYGALGAIAIGLLLSAGIPWSQLFPYLSKSVGTALGVQAIMGAVNGSMPGTDNQSTSPNIVIRGHDYFIKTETGEVKTTINQVMDIISQAENRVNIWKHETARAGTENELSSLLSHKGLEDNVIWRDTFTPGRQTVLSPEWEKLEESAGLKAILLKIESKIVTIDDFNELIQEATPESMRDRLRRRINVNQNTARSHQDDDGHAKMSLPVMADRVQPSRKRADRTQMQHGGKMGHRHSARTQKRTMSKSLKEAIEFFKGNIGRPIDQSLSIDISHTVLRNVATKLMGKPGINRDWLYNFCSSLSESVDDNGYNFQVVDEDCEPQNQADVICAEHSVQTAWAGEKQFAWESATQKHDNQEFSHDVSKWIEITGWTQRKLYNWLGY